MKKIFVLPAVVVMLILAGCQTRTVSRIDPGQAVDLSGRWNDTDSRLVAEEMIRDVLSRPWLPRFETRSGRVPVVIVGDVRNRSHEHIDAETFIRNMEREFVNSGTVRVVQGAEFREQIRQERADQQEFASPETVARWRREIGADYMLTGTMNSIVDQHGRDKIIYYQINLELTDMETNEKVWIGEKQIKKAVRN
jgi:penicillin-binding protein activator